MNTEQQNTNNGVKIGLTILGVIVLITGSFLLGKASTENSDTSSSDSANSTTETTDAQLEDVFDSTEEEIAQVEQEQEKLEEETEERIEEVTSGSKFTTAQEYILDDGCRMIIASTEDAAAPEVIENGVVAIRSLPDTQRSAIISCSVGQGSDDRNATVVDTDDISYLFSDDTLATIEEVKLITPPATGAPISDSVYKIAFKNGANVQIILPLNEPTQNHQISTVTVAKTKAVSTETYTNQYYPDLKLVYPSDWSFTTNANPLGYTTELVGRDIFLTKKFGDRNINLYFLLAPAYRIDGGGPVDPLAPSYTFDNGFKEFAVDQSFTGRLYTKERGGFDLVDTNIKYANISLENFSDKETVDYYVSIRAYSGQGGGSTGDLNEEELQEVRRIIENSTIK